MLSTDRKDKRNMNTHNSPWPAGGLGTPSDLRYPTGPGKQSRNKHGPNIINFNH